MVDPELDLDLELSFDEEAAYGVSYNRFWTSQFPTEFAVQQMAADMEVSIVDLESETTWLIKGGVNFSLTPSLALGLDAKYIAYEPKGEGEIEEDSVALNPLVVSAALKIRF